MLCRAGKRENGVIMPRRVRPGDEMTRRAKAKSITTREQLRARARPAVRIRAGRIEKTEEKGEKAGKGKR